MRSDIDEIYMKRALWLAEKGRGFASPNPTVGACLVRGGKIIAEGFHAHFGGAHAEVVALDKIKTKAKGATLYVTLEPCSSWGKTPPCTKAILESGVKRVVAACLDPNPKHAGRGIRILKRAGIPVQIGVLRKEAEAQNEAFRKWIKTKMPFVTLKMAQSLDGKIASRTGNSRWITSEPARNLVHELRSKVDGIVVGKNTVLRDNPRLTVHRRKSKFTPWRFILDSKGEVSVTKEVFRQKGVTVLVCSEKYVQKVSNKFLKLKVAILALPEKNGKLDLEVFLKKISAFGITSILVEGGGELAASFLQNHLVDRVIWMIAPKIIGGRDAKTSVEGNGVPFVKDALVLKNKKVYPLGEDIIIEGDL